MSKEKFIYNKHTLRYEKVTESFKVKLFRIFKFLSAVILSAIILLSVSYTYFPTPKEKARHPVRSSGLFSWADPDHVRSGPQATVVIATNEHHDERD